MAAGHHLACKREGLSSEWDLRVALHHLCEIRRKEKRDRTDICRLIYLLTKKASMRTQWKLTRRVFISSMEKVWIWILIIPIVLAKAIWYTTTKKI